MTTIDNPAVDESKVEEFLGKVLGDVAGLMAGRLATLGDRLGLWKDLAASGPATSAAMAARNGIAEWYAREWLAGMHSLNNLSKSFSHVVPSWQISQVPSIVRPSSLKVPVNRWRKSRGEKSASSRHIVHTRPSKDIL